MDKAWLMCDAQLFLRHSPQDGFAQLNLSARLPLNMLIMVVDHKAAVAETCLVYEVINPSLRLDCSVCCLYTGKQFKLVWLTAQFSNVQQKQGRVQEPVLRNTSADVTRGPLPSNDHLPASSWQIVSGLWKIRIWPLIQCHQIMSGSQYQSLFPRMLRQLVHR